MKVNLNEKEKAFLFDIHLNRNADEPCESNSEIKTLDNFFIKVNGKEPRQTQKLLNLLWSLVTTPDALDSTLNGHFLTSEEYDALCNKLKEVN